MSILSVNNYENLLTKCEFELKQLQHCEAHPEYDFIMFNLILGLNHLFEWFLKEKSINEEGKFKCIEYFNPFASPYDVSGDFKQHYKKHENFPSLNVTQEVIRKLCNKAKHFKVQKIERQDKNYTCFLGDDSMECGNPDAACGAYDHYLYFVDINNEKIDLEKLICKHIVNWREFVSNI